MAGHILLAEDDKALSALMQDFFRAAGVTVTPAYDGEQALVLAQAQPFWVPRGRGRLYHQAVFVSGAGGKGTGAHAAGPRAAAGRE